MTDTVTKRKQDIDIARGIAIILVVLGHAVSEYGTGFTGLEHVIYSFHMPLFFVVSGLVFRLHDGEDFGSFAARRAKGLMLPYLLFAALIFASHLAEKVLLHTDSRFFETLRTPAGLLNTLLLTTKSAFSNLWFLPCMLVAQMLLFAAVKYLKSKWLRAAICILPSLAVIFSSPKISLPLCLETAVVSLLFLFLGTQLQNRCFTAKAAWLLLAAAALVFFAAQMVYFTCYSEKGFSYYNVQFDVPWLFCLTAVSGSLLVILLAQRLQHCAPLELLGRHSLYIFGFHYLIQNLLRIGFEKLNLTDYRLLTLLLGTALNLAICTALSVLWAKIKRLILKKEQKQ